MEVINKTSKYSTYPWEEIQRLYDTGLGYRETFKKLNISHNCIRWGVENNKFRMRNHSESVCIDKMKGRFNKPLSIETKLKLSKIRKEFLSKHPDKHPNRILSNNKSRMSYPEKIAYDFLLSQQIDFIHNFYAKPYWIDFYIKNQNIGIEVDGARWHEANKDKIRDDYILKNYGIVIVRFTAKEILKNVYGLVACIDNAMVS